MPEPRKIARVVSAITSLAKAAADYAVADEHDSMSGTYLEEQELEEAFDDLFKEESDA